ncbi:MAG: AAA family ATPase, partial [Clostridia bacterium]|nr:AAA family ATPase [Clostridia bacterium]
MTIDEAKNEIKNTVRIYLEREGDGYAVPVERQRPVLLIGAPGIGKTAIMSEVAEELGIGFVGYTITHHTRQSAIGLPYITKKIYGGKEYSVTEYTMSEIVASVYDAIEKQGRKNGILFIDEINCVSETLAPAMLELLQHKKFGPHSIPSGWILTAAGNPDEYNKSATELDMVTLDRVKKITVEPDYTAFRKYALARGMHPAVTYFLELEKDSLFKAVRTPSGYEFVTPRGWEDLSYAIREYEKLSIPVTLSLINQYVRTPDTAASFCRRYE